MLPHGLWAQLDEAGGLEAAVDGKRALVPPERAAGYLLDALEGL